jgi:uncharacterized DUF497 family protein
LRLIVFEWDETKNRRNEQKHGISFELAREVFLDPLCLTIADPAYADEERFWTIGSLPNLVILVVVHTMRFSARAGDHTDYLCKESYPQREEIL